jgi:membrane protease YdiL (CAAX protease family)
VVILALAYLAALAGAEAIAAFVSPLWGIVLHFILLFGLIAASARRSPHQSHGLFLALGLVPLLRIVSFSMPSVDISQTYWYLVASFPLLLGAFAIARASNRRPADIGLTIRAFPLQMVVAVCGIGIGLLDYLILKPEPLISEFSWRGVVVPALVLIVATGFAEEVVFRGVIQREAEALGAWGWVYTAILSSVLQMGHHSILHWFVALAMALFFGWIVKRSGSILGVSLSHGLVNIGLYLLFPFIF